MMLQESVELLKDSFSQRVEHLFLSSTDSLWSQECSRELSEFLNRKFVSLIEELLSSDTASEILPLDLEVSDWTLPMSSIWQQHANKLDQKRKNKNQVEASQGYHRARPPCGKTFRKGDGVYRCRDCGLDDTCVLCSECFNNSTHGGHNTSFAISSGSGGCCDCGDREAWKILPNCTMHISASPVAASPSAAGLASAIDDRVSPLFRTLLGFVVNTFRHSAVQKRPPTSVRHFVQALSEVRSPTELEQIYARQTWLVILWNDEKHSFETVIEKVKDAAGCRDTTARRIAERVDAHGREVVSVYQFLESACHVASQISQIDLMTTISDAGQAFKEEAAGLIISWLKDICSCSISGDTLSMRKTLAACVQDDSAEGRLGYSKWNQLQALMLYDVRLWKQARSDLRDLFVCLLSAGEEVRAAMTSYYIQAYPIMIDTLIHTDREPENSFVQLSVQMLTVPSLVSRLLYEYDIFGLVLRGLITYFMSDQNEFAQRSVGAWQDIPGNYNKPLDVGSGPFKHKRYLQLLQDLKYLVANPSTASYLRSAPHKVGQLAEFLSNFQLVAPTSRAVHQHVEWETDIWVTAFTINFQLMRIEGFAADAFRSGDSSSLKIACEEVTRVILSLNHSRFRTLSVPTGFASRHSSHLRIVSFKVSSDSCSFHHPLHRLLGGLLGCLPNLQDPVQIGIGKLIGSNNKEHLAEIFDEPLRTIVLMAQIRCGLWVRNGLALRQQHLHYYDALQRDFTQDIDLFLLQCMFSALGSEHCLITVLDRFELLEILSDDQIDLYDAMQADQILEELVLTLTHCLNESALVEGWSLDEQVKQHIIQWLALGPTSFSELSRKVSERIADHATFDRTLKSIAVYKAPLGRHESGVYSLRSETFSEIDPLFMHYSRNQREDVERACLENRVNDDERPFFANASSSAAHSPLQKEILKVVDCKIFGGIVLFCLKRSLVTRMGACGTLLDTTLNLLGLATIHSQSRIFPMLTDLQGIYQTDWIAILIAAQKSDNLSKVCAAKIDWLLRRAQIAGILFADNSAGNSGQPVTDMEKTHRLQRQAQARKKALLLHFQEAQKTFADQLQGSDISEDEDDKVSEEHHGTCIVCQEDLDSSSKHAVLTYLQSSGLLSVTSLHADQPGSVSSKTLAVPSEKGQRSILHGIHASSCGHSMHMHCLASFETSVEDRIVMQFSRNHPEEPQQHKFTCPLCKSVYNVLLPIVPSGGAQIAISRDDEAYKSITDRLQMVLNQIRLRRENDAKTPTVDALFYTTVVLSLLHSESAIAKKLKNSIPTSFDMLQRLWALRLLLLDDMLLSSDMSQYVHAYEKIASPEDLLKLVITIAQVEPFRLAMWLLWRGHVAPSVLDSILRHLFAADLARGLFLCVFEFQHDSQATRGGQDDESTLPDVLKFISDELSYTLHELSLSTGVEWTMSLYGSKHRRTIVKSMMDGILARWSILQMLEVRQRASGEAKILEFLPESMGKDQLETISARYDYSGATYAIVSSCVKAWVTGVNPPDKILLSVKPTLVSLPDQLEVLFERSLQLHCIQCSKVPTDPAICLCCGQLVCSQSFCCMQDDRGECNLHMNKCGLESGIFLLPKKSVIVLLHGGKGTFMPAPYLDTHGEADIGFRRGRPQYLHEARYDDLQEIWQRQSIPNVVARKLDAIYDTGGWETL